MYFIGTTSISDDVHELCNRLIKIKVNRANTFPDCEHPKNDWAFKTVLGCKEQESQFMPTYFTIIE